MSGLDAICAKLKGNNHPVNTINDCSNYSSTEIANKMAEAETEAALEIRKNRRKSFAPRYLNSCEKSSEGLSRTDMETFGGHDVLDLSSRPSANDLVASSSSPSGAQSNGYSVDQHGALDLSCSTSTGQEMGSPGASTNSALHDTTFNSLSGLPLSNPAAALFNPMLGVNSPASLMNPFFLNLMGAAAGATGMDQSMAWINALSARCGTQGVSDNSPIDALSSMRPEETSSDDPPPFNSANPSPPISNDEDQNKESKGKLALYNPKSFEDSGDYIRRFASYEECGQVACRETGHRDHFHCLQCDKVLARREEMIRHFKWHKKREESLQHGFMRYSPNDNCANSSCPHNLKQTHYHCQHPKCGKIYISTSDVQMHANYHRKDQAIIQEGFQRFRATEDCQEPNCIYQKERTTHFHCRRPSCHFTFKNKADMEKHKNHHQKNDDFAKDGFRKFIKYESCEYPGCKYSKMMNHIHCIRPGCEYVVHSSSQILSHKRKHERRSGHETPPHVSLNGSNFNFDSTNQDNDNSNSGLNLTNRSDQDSCDYQKEALALTKTQNPVTELQKRQQDEIRIQVLQAVELYEKEEHWRDCFRRYTANDPCLSQCPLLYKDHYHCVVPTCTEVHKNRERVREHARKHAWDNAITEAAFKLCDQPDCSTMPFLAHYHCRWSGCNMPCPVAGPVFLRSKHYNLHDSLLCSSVNGKPVGHDLLLNTNEEIVQSSTSRMAFSQFNTSGLMKNSQKRRGRPPKYRRDVIVPRLEVSSEQWKDDGTIGDLSREMFQNSSEYIFCGFKMYSMENSECIDDLCMFNGKAEHFHCLRPRCHHATDSLAAVNLHRREFHHYLVIEEGFEFFDRTVDCRRPHCHNNKVSRHYHCVRPNCDYAFIRYNTMQQHTKKHLEIERGPSTSLSDTILMNTTISGNIKSDYSQDLDNSSEKSNVAMNDSAVVSQMRFDADMCNQMFCKFRKKVHFHCNECQQIFTDHFKMVKHHYKHKQERLRKEKLQVTTFRKRMRKVTNHEFRSAKIPKLNNNSTVSSSFSGDKLELNNNSCYTENKETESQQMMSNSVQQTEYDDDDEEDGALKIDLYSETLQNTADQSRTVDPNSMPHSTQEYIPPQTSAEFSC